jgi:hypothetical protein
VTNSVVRMTFWPALGILALLGTSLRR